MRIARELPALPDPLRPGVPRYSRRDWPAYRYVPGRDPHPNRDPRGHSYTPGLCLPRQEAWHAEDWPRLDAWRYGADLFNQFYFWEAHDSWEGLWAVALRGSPPALLLQGLIQVAAALLKVHAGVVAGASRLSLQGLQKLSAAAEMQSTLMGIDLHELQAELTRYFEPLSAGRLPLLDESVPVLRLEA